MQNDIFTEILGILQINHNEWETGSLQTRKSIKASSMKHRTLNETGTKKGTTSLPHVVLCESALEEVKRSERGSEQKHSGRPNSKSSIACNPLNMSVKHNHFSPPSLSAALVCEC